MKTVNRCKTVLLAAAISATGAMSFMPVAALSGSWKKDGNAWRYIYEDGTFPKSKWEKIHGSWYHFSADGQMESGWQKIDGSWYYLGTASEGSMKTGWVKDSGSWYFMDGSGKMKTGWIKTGGKQYYLDGSGKMKTGWIKTGGHSYYLKADGSLAVNTTIDGYQVGADGAWISGTDKPVQNNTASAVKFSQTTKKAIQEGYKKAQAETNGALTPSSIYYAGQSAAYSISDEAGTAYYKDIVKSSPDVSGIAPVLQDDFYVYLKELGYDIDGQLARFASEIKARDPQNLGFYLYNACFPEALYQKYL